MRFGWGRASWLGARGGAPAPLRLRGPEGIYHHPPALGRLPCGHCPGDEACRDRVCVTGNQRPSHSGVCGVRPERTLTGRAILMALRPLRSSFAGITWYCQPSGTAGTATADSAGNAGTATCLVLPRRPGRPPGPAAGPPPAPARVLGLRWPNLPARAPAARRLHWDTESCNCWYCTIHPLNSASGHHSWRPLVPAGHRARSPVPSPYCTQPWLQNPATVPTCELLTTPRQFVSAGHSGLLATRETITAPIGNVYSGRNRFSLAPAIGNLPPNEDGQEPSSCQEATGPHPRKSALEERTARRAVRGAGRMHGAAAKTVSAGRPGSRAG